MLALHARWPWTSAVRTRSFHHFDLRIRCRGLQDPRRRSKRCSPANRGLCRTRACYHLGKRIWSRIQSPGIAVTFLMTAVCCRSRPRQSHTSRSSQTHLPPPRIFIRVSLDYIGLLAVVWVRRTAVPSVRVATKSTRRVMKPSSGQLLNQNQVHS